MKGKATFAANWVKPLAMASLLNALLAPAGLAYAQDAMEVISARSKAGEDEVNALCLIDKRTDYKSPAKGPGSERAFCYYRLASKELWRDDDRGFYRGKTTKFKSGQENKLLKWSTTRQLPISSRAANVIREQFQREPFPKAEQIQEELLAIGLKHTQLAALGEVQAEDAEAFEELNGFASSLHDQIRAKAGTASPLPSDNGDDQKADGNSDDQQAELRQQIEELAAQIELINENAQLEEILIQLASAVSSLAPQPNPWVFWILLVNSGFLAILCALFLLRAARSRKSDRPAGQSSRQDGRDSFEPNRNAIITEIDAAAQRRQSEPPQFEPPQLGPPQPVQHQAGSAEEIQAVRTLVAEALRLNGQRSDGIDLAESIRRIVRQRDQALNGLHEIVGMGEESASVDDCLQSADTDLRTIAKALQASQPNAGNPSIAGLAAAAEGASARFRIPPEVFIISEFDQSLQGRPYVEIQPHIAEAAQRARDRLELLKDISYIVDSLHPGQDVLESVQSIAAALERLPSKLGLKSARPEEIYDCLERTLNQVQGLADYLGRPIHSQQDILAAFEQAEVALSKAKDDAEELDKVQRALQAEGSRLSLADAAADLMKRLNLLEGLAEMLSRIMKAEPDQLASVLRRHFDRLDDLAVRYADPAPQPDSAPLQALEGIESKLQEGRLNKERAGQLRDELDKIQEIHQRIAQILSSQQIVRATRRLVEERERALRYLEKVDGTPLESGLATAVEHITRRVATAMQILRDVVPNGPGAIDELVEALTEEHKERVKQTFSLAEYICMRLPDPEFSNRIEHEKGTFQKTLRLELAAAVPVLEQAVEGLTQAGREDALQALRVEEIRQELERLLDRMQGFSALSEVWSKGIRPGFSNDRLHYLFRAEALLRTYFADCPEFTRLSFAVQHASGAIRLAMYESGYGIGEVPLLGAPPSPDSIPERQAFDDLVKIPEIRQTVISRLGESDDFVVDVLTFPIFEGKACKNRPRVVLVSRGHWELS